MERSIIGPSRTTASLGGCLALGASLALAAGEQAEQFTPEFRQLHTTFDAKHTPKIVAPDCVKRGEWFDVTVSVGAGDSTPRWPSTSCATSRSTRTRWRSRAPTCTRCIRRRR